MAGWRGKTLFFKRTLKRTQKRQGRIKPASWPLIPVKQLTAEELTEEWLIAILPHCCAWARAGKEWFCMSTLQQNTHTESLSPTHRGLRSLQVWLAWKVLSIVRVHLSWSWKPRSHPADVTTCVRGCWCKQPGFVRKSHLWSAWIFLSIRSHGKKEAFVLLDDRKGCAAKLILQSSTFWMPGHS